jgi:trimeric autotransporter adhesin
MKVKFLFVVFFCSFACAQTNNADENTNAFANGAVQGSGTPHFVPLWLSTNQLGNSVIFQSQAKIGIGTQAPTAGVDIRAVASVLALSVHGGNFSPTRANGGDGMHVKGGDGDPGFDGDVGGAGIVVTGGNGTAGGTAIFAVGGRGPIQGGAGGVFVAGNNLGDGIDVSKAPGCTGTHCVAGNFIGDVFVSGTLTAATKHFRIDHPLDPANKYLIHAGVESSEMKNIYDGMVTLDQAGEAVVQLPSWFDAVNGNVRYQLTAVGTPSPGLYISRKLEHNRFKIGGGVPGGEVSWQITGVRRDRYAQANPLVPEQEKDAIERGHYLNPELYSMPDEKSVQWVRHPAMMRNLAARASGRREVIQMAQEAGSH